MSPANLTEKFNKIIFFLLIYSFLEFKVLIQALKKLLRKHLI